MYNGKYDSFISVVVSGNDDKDCLLLSRLITSLCKAWSFNGVRYNERKIPKKKPFTTREIMIYHTGYSHNVIIFRESLGCIVNNFLIKDRFSVYSTIEPARDESVEESL